MRPFDTSVEYDLSSSNFGRAIMNSFKIQSQLYQGTGSEIFLVEDSKTQHIYTLKAVKKMPQMTLNLELLKTLIHEQIAPIVDYGESDNYYYIIKPYIEGISLKKRIQTNGPLSPEETLAMTLQILSVFEYLHTLTPPMIYRDLKPDNLIIKPDGQLILIDLISIRALDISQNNDTFYIGTKGYAAPEQYGYSQTDVRTDIYGIGATIYYLCTGKRPEIKTLKAYKPSQYDSPDFVELMGIIQKCMHFDPEKRYQDFETLRKALTQKTGLNWFRPKMLILALSVVLVLGLLVLMYRLGLQNSIETTPEPTTFNQIEPLNDVGIIQADIIEKDITQNTQAIPTPPVDDTKAPTEPLKSDSDPNTSQPESTTIQIQLESESEPESVEKISTPTDYNREAILSYTDIIVDHLPLITSGIHATYLDNAINFKITTNELAATYQEAMYYSAIHLTSNFTDPVLQKAIYDTTIHEMDVNLVNGVGRIMSLDPKNRNSFLIMLFDEHLECIGYNFQMNLKAQHSFYKQTSILEANFANQVKGDIYETLSRWGDQYTGQGDLFIIRINEWLPGFTHQQLWDRFDYIPKYLQLKAEGQKTLIIRFSLGDITAHDGSMSLYLCAIEPLHEMVPGIPYKIVDPNDAGWIIPEDLVIMR